MEQLTKRQRYDRLLTQLDQEFSSFRAQYRDLGDYILPTRQRWTTSDANKGDRRNLKIIDSTATQSAGILSAGMMSGVTSPARRWFRLTTPDPDLAEFGPVKEWLDTVEQRMATAFLRSNLYNILPTQYQDLGVFGTSPILVDEDFKDVLRAISFPVGSYRIATDSRGAVNVFSREFRMTIRQLIEMFGTYDKKTGKPDWSIFSDHVKNQYEQSNYETWVDVCQVIGPNNDYHPNKPFAKFKPFSSCYFEKGSSAKTTTYHYTEADRNKFLRESGYDYFPVLCPRWAVSGEDIYATSCPGMVSIGDIKQLQYGEKMIAEAVTKTIRPPMTGPSSLLNRKTSILPGDFTADDSREGQRGYRPVFELRFPIQEAEAKQDQIRLRIKQAFYEPLFLMLANSDRRQITAREIDERHEEKLLALGPVLERLNQDQNDPLIDIAFAIMHRRGDIPEPPEELAGTPLKIDYISMMAQAQKMIGLGSVDRLLTTVANVAAVKPGALDKIDEDQLVDVYADLLSAPPKIVRTDDKVAELRRAREQAAQAERTMAAVQQGAQTAKELSSADMEGDNALTRLVDQANAGSVLPQ